MYRISVIFQITLKINNIVAFGTWMSDPHMLGFGVFLQISIGRSPVGAELALEPVGFVVNSRMVSNKSRVC